MLFSVANISFIIRLKWMTMTKYFPWPPEYGLHEFLLESHEKQSNGISWKGGFFALSKLVYFRKQLLELVESFMEVWKATDQTLQTAKTKWRSLKHAWILPLNSAQLWRSLFLCKRYQAVVRPKIASSTFQRTSGIVPGLSRSHFESFAINLEGGHLFNRKALRLPRYDNNGRYYRSRKKAVGEGCSRHSLPHASRNTPTNSRHKARMAAYFTSLSRCMKRKLKWRT